MIAPAAAPPLSPGDLPSAWPWSPGALVALGVAAVGWAVASRRGGRVPGAAWWWSALAVIAVAVLSPLDTVAESLASLHMVQHLLLGLVAPFLVVRARPLRVLGRLARPEVRRDLGRASAPLLRSPAVPIAAVGAHVGIWWAWHVPGLYDLAVHHSFVHLLEHATLFAAGLGLWGAAWPAGPPRRAGGAGLFAVFFAALGTGALAALLTLSTVAFYATDAATAHAWGLTRLSDQQLAGAIMWVPGGFLYLAAGVALFSRWLARRPARSPDLDPDRVVLSDRVC